MIVFDDGFAQVEWNESATFNVIIEGRAVDCFTQYNVDKRDAIDVAREHMEDFYLQF